MASLLNRSMEEAETVNVIRNSPKGRLRYNNGWDERKNSIWQLVSSVQADTEKPKIAVLERALRITSRLSEKNHNSFQEEGHHSPVDTSSGSGSRLTEEVGNDLTNDVTNGRNDGNNHKSKRHSLPATLPSSTGRKKGYGIREDEYDDDEMYVDFQLSPYTDIANHYCLVMQDYENERTKIALEKSGIRKKLFQDGLQTKLEQLNVNPTNEESAVKQKLKAVFKVSEEDEMKIMSELEKNRKLLEKQFLVSDKQVESKQKAQVELRKRQAKEAAAAYTRRATQRAEAEAAEVQTKLIQAQKLQIEADEVRQLLEQQELLAKQQKEKEEEAANVALLQAQQQQQEQLQQQQEQLQQQQQQLQQQQLQQQQTQISTKDETSGPQQLKGLILKEDCDKYSKCTELIIQYENATKEISASSPDINVKKFYSGASNSINTPLNSLANTETHQIARKVAHFIDMIEGKPVVGSSTMTAPFCASALPNGKVFVMRLLAFRFLKKAESEILSEKKGFIPLASIGINLSKKYPAWGSLVQAYFYKLCPFLVPFSFPRGNQTVQEYCSSIGYDLQGEDSTLLNELTNRIKGYCSLYAMMVRIVDKQGNFAKENEFSTFFSLGGVWEILTKTLTLEPQADVTVMVIQTLLELLADRLQQVYGKQFFKMMHVLTSVYLQKINSISHGAAKSGVVRFQTYLEQQFKVFVQ